eukprot:112593_1
MGSCSGKSDRKDSSSSDKPEEKDVDGPRSDNTDANHEIDGSCCHESDEQSSTSSIQEIYEVSSITTHQIDEAKHALRGIYDKFIGEYAKMTLDITNKPFKIAICISMILSQRIKALSDGYQWANLETETDTPTDEEKDAGIQRYISNRKDIISFNLSELHGPAFSTFYEPIFIQTNIDNENIALFNGLYIKCKSFIETPHHRVFVHISDITKTDSNIQGNTPWFARFLFRLFGDGKFVWVLMVRSTWYEELQEEIRYIVEDDAFDKKIYQNDVALADLEAEIALNRAIYTLGAAEAPHAPLPTHYVASSRQSLSALDTNPLLPDPHPESDGDDSIGSKTIDERRDYDDSETHDRITPSAIDVTVAGPRLWRRIDRNNAEYWFDKAKKARLKHHDGMEEVRADIEAKPLQRKHVIRFRSDIDKAIRKYNHFIFDEQHHNSSIEHVKEEEKTTLHSHSTESVQEHENTLIHMLTDFYYVHQLIYHEEQHVKRNSEFDPYSNNTPNAFDEGGWRAQSETMGGQLKRYHHGAMWLNTWNYKMELKDLFAQRQKIPFIKYQYVVDFMMSVIQHINNEDWMALRDLKVKIENNDCVFLSSNSSDLRSELNKGLRANYGDISVIKEYSLSRRNNEYWDDEQREIY